MADYELRANLANAKPERFRLEFHLSGEAEPDGEIALAALAEEQDAPPEVVELAERRRQARATRDFDEADRLREQIEAAGWEARDVADGFQLVPK